MSSSSPTWWPYVSLIDLNWSRSANRIATILSGALTANDGVVETLHEQRAVRQPGERVVQRDLARALGRLAEIGACLRVEEVGGRDVGQGLRGHHRARRRAGRRRRGTCRARRAGCRPGAAGT